MAPTEVKTSNVNMQFPDPFTSITVHNGELEAEERMSTTPVATSVGITETLTRSDSPITTGFGVMIKARLGVIRLTVTKRFPLLGANTSLPSYSERIFRGEVVGRINV